MLGLLRPTKISTSAERLALRNGVRARLGRLIIASASAVLACALVSVAADAGEQPSWLNGIFNNSSTPRPPKTVPSNATAATTAKTSHSHSAVVVTRETHERTQAPQTRGEKARTDSSKQAGTDSSKHVAARPNASAFPPVTPLE